MTRDVVIALVLAGAFILGRCDARAMEPVELPGAPFLVTPGVP